MRFFFFVLVLLMIRSCHPPVLAIVPAVAQLVGLAFVPDSPRFLLSANREAEALAVLTSLRGCPRVARDELDEIAAIEASEAHFTFRQLLSRKYRGPMLAGMGIALFQAFDGINAIMYYSTTIFNIAGQKNAVMATFAVGLRCDASFDVVLC